MDNHPIPQDVTGFQFKLIGNMTLKQFLYLAGGCIIAWIFYALPIPILIKLPGVLLPAFLGFSFAFLPIEGRPMDAMVSLFFKALFAPDQYIYAKTGKPLNIVLPSPKKTKNPTTQINQAQISQMVSTITQKKPQKPKTKLDEKEELFLKTILSNPVLVPSANKEEAPQIISMNPVSSSNFNSQVPNVQTKLEPKKEKPIHIEKESPEELEKELEAESIELKKEIAQAQTEETAQNTPLAHHKTEELQKQLEEILAQKKELEGELLALKAKFEAQKPTRKFNQIPGGIKISYAPEVANLITGIIKDPKGNVLPNILVDIQDKNGDPVRAFKTNVIGQFASVTPLPNGNYKITFEDASGRHKFNSLEVVVEGKIIPPFEITAIDERDELRKDLFGK